MESDEDNNSVVTPQVITIAPRETGAFSFTDPSRHQSIALGSSHTISWSASGFSTRQVTLSLYEGNEFVTQLGQESLDTGTFQASFTGIDLGSNYSIRIHSSDGGIDYYSAPFIVFDGASSLSYQEPISGSIWVKGEPYAIRWTETGARTLDLFAELYQGEIRVAILGNADPLTRELTFSSLPSSVANGGGYLIRLRSAGDSALDYWSEEFSISDTPPFSPLKIFGKYSVDINGDLEIENGDTSPSLADGTLFESTAVGGSRSGTGITLEHNYSGLSTVYVTIDSPHFDMGSNTEKLEEGLRFYEQANPVSLGNLRYTPQSAGTHTATVNITTDKGDDFSFSIRGNAYTQTNPRLSVYGKIPAQSVEINPHPGQLIEFSTLNDPSQADGTDFGVVAIGDSSESLFYLLNDGSGRLDVFSDSVDPSRPERSTRINSNQFSIKSIRNRFNLDGGTVFSWGDLRIEFTPTIPGYHEALVTVVWYRDGADNDDPRSWESRVFKVRGHAVANQNFSISETVDVSSEGGLQNLIIDTNVSWNWSSSASWIESAEPKFQTASQEVTISVEPNTSDVERQATIEIVAGTETRTITISQEAFSPVLHFSESRRVFGAEASEYALSVVSNTTWQWREVEQVFSANGGDSDVSYAPTLNPILSVTGPTSFTGSDAIQFTVSANPNYTRRGSFIEVFDANGLSEIFEIIQLPALLDFQDAGAEFHSISSNSVMPGEQPTVTVRLKKIGTRPFSNLRIKVFADKQDSEIERLVGQSQVSLVRADEDEFLVNIPLAFIDGNFDPSSYSLRIVLDTNIILQNGEIEFQEVNTVNNSIELEVRDFSVNLDRTESTFAPVTKFQRQADRSILSAQTKSGSSMKYRLLKSDDLIIWETVDEFRQVDGNGGVVTFDYENLDPRCFYQVQELEVTTGGF